MSRGRFLKSIAAASAGFTLPGYLAEALAITPTVTEGPYYPLADDIPLDKDNDLVQLNDNLTLAAGEIETISGTIYDANGQPVRGALVELWHADREGDYLYSTGVGRNADCDANFAGFGQFLTGKSGQFKFRTIKAGLYSGRARHFHWGITLPGEDVRTTTQTGWNEIAYDLNGNRFATQNSNDNIFSTVSDATLRAAMLLDFTPVEGTTTGETAASWDYFSGTTPSEPTYPGGSLLVAPAGVVAGPNGTERFRLQIPAYPDYCYEVYANPTLADLDWKALPFALEASEAFDRHQHIATEEGLLEIYVAAPPERGFYKVSYREPGANTGTPSGGGGGPGGPGGPR